MTDTYFMYHTRRGNASPHEGRTAIDRDKSTVRSDRDLAVYAISVAGELTGVDPQMLRVYETRGLVTPARTSGGTRRYSARDLDRIDRITMYLATGLNLAGIERVFVLEAEAEDLRDRVRRLGGRPPRQAEPRSTPYS
jgi:MerR family transcriptional regulator/heat shock protein HspR